MRRFGSWCLRCECSSPTASRIKPGMDLLNDTRPQPQVSTGACHMHIFWHEITRVLSLRCGVKPVELEMYRGRELRRVYEEIHDRVGEEPQTPDLKLPSTEYLPGPVKNKVKNIPRYNKESSLVPKSSAPWTMKNATAMLMIKGIEARRVSKPRIIRIAQMNSAKTAR